MKPEKQNDGSYLVKKGRTEFKIYPGHDRPYILPTIVHEGAVYPMKVGLLVLWQKLKIAYSEEQVLEALMDAI